VPVGSRDATPNAERIWVQEIVVQLVEALLYVQPERLQPVLRWILDIREMLLEDRRDIHVLRVQYGMSVTAYAVQQSLVERRWVGGAVKYSQPGTEISNERRYSNVGCERVAAGKRGRGTM
jgi:hypothetical protein